MEESEICETTEDSRRKTLRTCSMSAKTHIANTKLAFHGIRWTQSSNWPEYYGVSIDYLVGLTDEPKPYPRKKK